jgi:hypothetical protein
MQLCFLQDIWTIAEFTDGEQHDLFVDVETLKSRLKSAIRSK